MSGRATRDPAPFGHEHRLTMSDALVNSRPIASRDGTRLHLTEMGDADAARTLVVIHGYGEHGGRYIERMKTFTDAGYRVLIPDMRGHGQSEGARGHVMRWSDYVDDVRAVFGEVATDASSTGVLGHSNGGLIVAASILAGATPVAAAALSSPLLGISVVPPKWKLVGAKVLSRFAPKVSLPSEIDPEVVSHDPDVVATYRTDPHNHHVNNARWYTEAVATMDDAHARAHTIDLPLLVMQAGDDRLVSARASAAFADRVPDAVYEEIAGAYHELLFEPDGQRHADRLLAWFDDHLAGGA